MIGYIKKSKIQDKLQDLRFERDLIIKGAHTADTPRRIQIHLEIKIYKKLLNGL